MAGLANGRGIVEFVAVNADAHGRHARRLGYCTHFSDLAVARLALYTGLYVFAVRPIHTRSNRVNPHPRNGLIRLREGGEFLDGGFALRNDRVTGHAGAGRRESHQVAWLWICVAGLAFQTQCQVRLVAVGNRLHGWRVFGQVVGHVPPGVRGAHRLLCLHAERQEQRHRRQYD
jgi:hypothetical protein